MFRLRIFGSFCATLAFGMDSAMELNGPCTQLNKEKAMYAYPTFDPPLSQGDGAFDVVVEVQLINLDDLRAFGKNGIFASFPVHWHGARTIGGYFGPQATGHGDPTKEQVLFSLWDHKGDATTWQPALPRSPECKRNCNDCSSEESTGTQCKVFIPARSGQTLRLRLRQTATDVTSTYNGTEWVGDEWEVTIMDVASGEQWLVGRQLLTGVQGVGLKDIESFNEHIGCTPCGSFDSFEQRAGPWVLKPKGTRLTGVSSHYSCDACTCKDHIVANVNGTRPRWSFASGPSVGDHADWKADIFSCDDGVHDCDSAPSVVPTAAVV